MKLAVAMTFVTCPILAMPDESDRAPKATDLRIAADRFDEGRSSFKVGAFAEAAEHFEAADARAPSSAALGLAMRSRSEAGHFAKAATLAELVLVRHPELPELVQQANAIILAHQAELAHLTIECASRCELVIDKKLVHGSSMTVWRVYVEPGTHEVVANFAQERDAATTATIEAGESSMLKLAPPPVVEPQVAVLPVVPPVLETPPPTMPSPHHHKGLPPIYFWAGVGGTSLLTAVTVWSGIDTLNNPGADAVRKGCVAGDTNCALYKEGKQKELRTNILIGSSIVVALATAATGIWATDFGRRGTLPQRGAPNWSIRPVASVGLGDSALLGAEGRF